MSFLDSKHATYENRWYALVVIALALAVVIIDNTVLNVSIPYMIRDLHTTLPSIEWVVSGYALTLATVLITMGRAGDLFGRKKVFLIGMVLFAAGSLIGSEAADVSVIIFGRAIVQALGAAMALTSALSLLATDFKGRDRAIAFGVWGAIAGASATVGPLLGGYLTAYYSWRWSLRINVLISALAILGSVFIKESKGEAGKKFDFIGTLLSGLGLFMLVFAFIRGSRYGWFAPRETFSLFGIAWPIAEISVIPFLFAASLAILAIFALWEHRLEKEGKHPVLRPSIFSNRGFSTGAVSLMLLSLGMFGLFFLLPMYMENVLGLDAFMSGVYFIPTSIGIFIFGIVSGFISSRINPKWMVMLGFSVMSIGAFLIIMTISPEATALTLAPVLFIYGLGLGLGSAQLSNVILSSAPASVAGEASAVMTTMRQIGASIGIALVGAMLTTSLLANISSAVQADSAIPADLKGRIIEELGSINIEAGQMPGNFSGVPLAVQQAIRADLNDAFTESVRSSMYLGFFFILCGVLLSFLIPKIRAED